MCLYAQLVQTKNKQCKISWCYLPNLSSLLLKVSVVSADITISGKLFHTFTILGAKEN